MPIYPCDTVPAAVPAGITKSGRATPAQTTLIVIGPCWPAAAPVMVLRTSSAPGAGS